MNIIDKLISRLNGFKWSEASIKQFYGFLVAAAIWAIGKWVNPQMADSLVAVAPLFVGTLVAVIFGVDVAGLARQNKAKDDQNGGGSG